MNSIVSKRASASIYSFRWFCLSRNLDLISVIFYTAYAQFNSSSSSNVRINLSSCRRRRRRCFQLTVECKKTLSFVYILPLNPVQHIVMLLNRAARCRHHKKSIVQLEFICMIVLYCLRYVCYYIRITRCYYLHEYVRCRNYTHCIVVCFLFIINDRHRMYMKR